MSSFRMIHSDLGDEVQVSFVCQHCSGGGIEDLSPSERFRNSYEAKFSMGGECSRCNGTGFDPAPLPNAKICRACGGTAVCPYCGGNFARNWEELPMESQERFLKHWEQSGTYPGNYASFGRVYANPAPIVAEKKAP